MATERAPKTPEETKAEGRAQAKAAGRWKVKTEADQEEQDSNVTPIRQQGRGGLQEDPQTQMGEVDLSGNADLVKAVGDWRKAKNKKLALSKATKEEADERVKVSGLLGDHAEGKKEKRIRVGEEVIIYKPEGAPTDVSFTRQNRSKISLEKKPG